MWFKFILRDSSPKNENVIFICLPQGIQDVGDFVSSVEHKQRCLTQTVAVCQSYTGTSKKIEYHEKVHFSCNLFQKVKLSYLF